MRYLDLFDRKKRELRRELVNFDAPGRKVPELAAQAVLPVWGLQS
jgi:hypothetical protein